MTLQSCPLGTGLQRTDHSQLNVPNSGSDAAKEMTENLACDVFTEAQLPHAHTPEALPNTSAGPTVSVATAWGLGQSSLGNLWQCIHEPLKWAEKERECGSLGWNLCKSMSGWLLSPPADICKRLTQYQQSVRQILFWFVKVRSKLIEGQRSCQDWGTGRGSN